jgi:predicted nucleic acid-binding protein
MIILDTNVVSALMRAEPFPEVEHWFDAQLPSSLWLNAITLMELHFGLLTMPSGKRHEASVAALNRFLERLEHRVAAFDSHAALAAAELAALRKEKGRPGELRDTMIAGIAVASHADAIATHNVRHFADLAIEIINPFD